MLSWKLGSVTLIAVCTILVDICSSSLPADLIKCKAGDNVCITDKMNYIIRKYPDGNPEMGLQTLKAVELNNFSISESDPKRPVQLNFVLKAGTFYGLENVTITKTIGFERDPSTSKFEVYGTIPQLVVRGKYVASGRILLFPLNGHGNGEIFLTNVQLKYKVKPRVRKENNLTFVTVPSAKAKVDIDGLSVKMENLMDGNKELSDSLNNIINENWRDIWTEVQPGINRAVADICVKMLAGVLEKISYDDFYID